MDVYTKVGGKKRWGQSWDDFSIFRHFVFGFMRYLSCDDIYFVVVNPQTFCLSEIGYGQPTNFLHFVVKSKKVKIVVLLYITTVVL